MHIILIEAAAKMQSTQVVVKNESVWSCCGNLLSLASV